jgi:hypothetical protein
LNHVLGSYNAVGTSGEIDIAGFEIGARGGCREYAVAWGLNLLMFGLGLIVRPRPLFRAFVRSRGASNAYSLESVQGAFLERRLGEVRAELGIPDGARGASMADCLAFAGWAILAMTPLVLVVGAIVLVVVG